mgnify:CR=1 FL=1|tara:strand:+ start:83 stop:424 length:342 start_codon:yes stop_codon:yes gene_type:complete
MRIVLLKFLLFFFILGINTPYNYLIIDNLNKNSISYAYLCKFDNDANSNEQTINKNCVSCILKSGDSEKKVILPEYVTYFNISVTSINFLNKRNLHYNLKTTFQKNRDPPFFS